MRIGINALTNFSGGTITHFKNVLRHWGEFDKKNEFYIFTTSQNLSKQGKVQNENIHYKLFKIPALSLYSRLVWEQMVFPFHLKKAGIDILFCPSNYGPIFSSIKEVLMVSNIAPFRGSVIENEKSYVQKIRLRILKILIEISSKKANIVIFPSKYGQQLVSNNFNISEEKTVVIYHGKDNSFQPIKDTKKINEVRRRIGIKNDFILCVAHIYRYKNLRELLEAFVKVRNTIGDSIQLLIAGRGYDQRYLSEISSVINRYGLKDAVIIKEVLWAELPYLYSDCLFFISPSTCEIFSQVLVEAMSCGAPTLCANLTAMPEICEDAALYFDPYNVEDIADKILLVLKNEQLREELTQKALKRMEKFPTWEEVAKKTFDVIEQVAKKSEG